jgi:hypothetical protein
MSLASVRPFTQAAATLASHRCAPAVPARQQAQRRAPVASMAAQAAAAAAATAGSRPRDALVQDAVVWASQHGLVVGLGERPGWLAGWLAGWLQRAHSLLVRPCGARRAALPAPACPCPCPRPRPAPTARLPPSAGGARHKQQQQQQQQQRVPQQQQQQQHPLPPTHPPAAAPHATRRRRRARLGAHPRAAVRAAGRLPPRPLPAGQAGEGARRGASSRPSAAAP